MTQQPFSAAALRGAVDLSALAGRAQSPPGGAAAAGSRTGRDRLGAAPNDGDDGVLVHATDASFAAVVNGTVSVPAVLVLWAEQLPETADYLQLLAGEARARQGKFRVVGVEIGASPGIVQAVAPVLQEAFGQVGGLPVVLGLIKGQPMPFYVGPQSMEAVRPLLDKFLEAAVSNGVTGRVEAPDQAEPSLETDQQAEAAPSLPPQHEAAFEAIERGDLAAAVTAYQQALADDPADEEAGLGLAQVQLLQRTQGLDAATVRQAAAQDPSDVEAQTAAADLDLVGGHVEDAFARLIDTVRRTSGQDRDRVRQHLLGLFELVGPADPRVGRARQALMSALF